MLFQDELHLFETHKKISLEPNYSSEELYPHYIALLHHYEKLLNTTMKTTKISDIQGKTLKNKENEIRAVNETLKQVEASRKRLISEISHELGSPMIAIQQFISGMINGSIKPEESFLKIIHEKITLVNRLIEELFDLAKLEEPETSFRFESIPVEKLPLFFEKFSLECKAKEIELHVSPFQLTRSDATLSIDPFRIQQVITNIIENAMKYTPKGGKITINGTEKEDHLFLIEIIDTGLGIEESALPLVFERFYKRENPLHPEASSTGLGLAIAKEIIRKHNGEIGVASRIGEGSTFYFTLPLIE